MRSGPSSDEAATQGIYDLATWQCGHVLGIMPPKQSSKVVIEPIPLTATTVDIVRLLHPLQVESVSITVQGGKGTATVVLSSTDDAKNACRISSVSFWDSLCEFEVWMKGFDRHCCSPPGPQ